MDFTFEARHHSPDGAPLFSTGRSILIRDGWRIAAAGFTVTPIANSMHAWEHLKRADDDALIARISSPPGTPCGVALAQGGLYANPNLKVLLLATEPERD